MYLNFLSVCSIVRMYSLFIIVENFKMVLQLIVNLRVNIRNSSLE